MIRGYDLMLGCLVMLSDKTIVRVCQITKKKIGYHLRDNENRMRYALISEIEPIRITPDFLNMNGFRYDEASESYEYKDNENENLNCTLTKKDLVVNIFGDGSLFVSCNNGKFTGIAVYAHELQILTAISNVKKTKDYILCRL